MRPSFRRRPRGRLAAVAGLGLAGLLAASAQAQDPPAPGTPVDGLRWQLDTLWGTSRWEEHATPGQRLLDERGALPGLRLQARMAAPAERLWTLRLEAHSGQRDYNGQSSRGAAVHTRTGLHQLSLGLDIQQALTPRLALTADLSPTWLQRQLQGTADAAGYTEHWQWQLALLGLRWQQPWGPGQFSAQAAAGAPLAPRLQVQLPGLDTLTLHPRPGAAARLAIDYQWPMAADDVAGWTWQAGLEAETLRFRASPAVAGTLGGVLRASVSQPATQTWALRGHAGASLHWR